MRAIFLVDNGSLRPQATHNLRRVAFALSQQLGETVQAASLLHSNKIPPDEVDDIPAMTLGPAAERSAENGATEINCSSRGCLATLWGHSFLLAGLKAPAILPKACIVLSKRIWSSTYRSAYAFLASGA